MYGFKHLSDTYRLRLEESVKNGDHGGSLILNIKYN